MEPPVLSEDFEGFVENHKAQLETSDVPRHFWEMLYRKLVDETLDAGKNLFFARVQDEEGEEGETEVAVSREEGIRKDDPSQIYLIDHAWTFRPSDARSVLSSNDSLRKRLADMMDLDSSSLEEVLPRLWRFSQTYSLNADQAEDAVPIWYVLDELGSRISHSLEPNFRLVPFCFRPRQIVYSLLFPIKDVDFNEIVTRNYVEGPPTDDETIKALLLPWYEIDFSSTDFRQSEPAEQFFQSGRHLENASGLDECLNGTHMPVVPERPKVFTDYSVLRENLRTDGRYDVTDSFDEADILWLNTHFKDYTHLRKEYPNKLINQFPFEHILTVKDLFAVVARRDESDPLDLETLPLWLPTTFNLMTELPKFAAYFQRRKLAGLDNYWIVKPFNLARSIDTHITDNIDFIARLAMTAPKVACRYISRPVLFHRVGIGRVKFDIRYCVLLRDVSPLRLLAHRKFYLRFANQPFSLDEFDVYEKHFTVMNYADDAEMKNMRCEEFVGEFERDTGNQWDAVESKIFSCFKSLFRKAIALPPPRGFGYNPQSRAMYAIDLMLEWHNGDIQPVLLELNWAPDCKRACEFYPTFFGDVFDALFKDDLTSANVVEIV